MHRVKITDALIDGKKTTLNEPLTVNIERPDKYYFIRYDELNIAASGTTEQECVEEFKGELAFVYKEYGLSPDDKLGPGAIELKRRILQIVSGME